MNKAASAAFPRATTRRINPAWMLILGASSSLLISVCMWQLFFDDSLARSWPLQVSSALIAWGLIYVITTRKQFGTVYLFGSAYLLSLIVFHLSQVMYHGFGLEHFRHYVSGTQAIWIEKASWASLLAVACLGIGTALSPQRRRKLSSVQTERYERDFSKTLAAAYWIGLGLLAAAVFGLALTLITVGNIFAYTRLEFFAGVGDTRGFSLFLLAAPSSAIMMVVGAKTRATRFLAYVTAAIIVVLLLLLGYRSSALFAGLVGAVVWVKVGRKIPLPVAVVAVLIVVLVIPAVRVLRDLGTLQDISQEKVTQAFETTRSSEVILEIGGTNGILANVMRWVDQGERFWLGQSYYWALTEFVPNFTLTMERRGESLDGARETLKTLREDNPARWYTYKVNRWKFDHGQGHGFSTVAEPYLNFGYPGIFVYFIGMGFLLGRLDQVDLRTHPKTLIFSGALLWPLIKSVRNSFGVFIKPLSLMLIVILAWRLFTFWKHHR